MNLFEEFQEFRKILCVCPHCGEIVRLSDLKLKTKGKAVKTWLDEYAKKSRDMDIKEENFYEISSKLREKAVAKGRKEAQKVINNAISPEFKALKLDPFDIKPIFNPVDFVVFDGMNSKKQVSNVIFLSQKTHNTLLNGIRKKITEVIKKKQYEWQVARINEQGKIELE